MTQTRRALLAGAAGGRSGVAIYPDAGIAIALCSNLSETPLDPMPTIAALADAFGA